MERFIKFLYTKLPKSIIYNLGQNKILKKVKDYFLVKNGKPKLTTERIQWGKELSFLQHQSEWLLKQKTKVLKVN